MISFNKLNKNVEVIADYMQKSEVEFCDISVGTKYMWRDDFVIDYAIFNDTLIMRESCRDYKNAFYFPCGKDVMGALEEIEKFSKGLPFTFCCIDEERLKVLQKRYPFCEYYFLREWSDYIYSAQSFKTYSGKKLSGQRNHVNKFKKNYPNYVAEELTVNDLPKVKDFLGEFEMGMDFSMWSARVEEEKVYDLIENSFRLNQKSACIKVDGKIVALAVGERVKNTLIIHIEKGLKNYEGVYPTMAQEYAKLFAIDGVEYVNREEDCGDEGLKTSKLQYRPLEIKNKYIVTVKSAINRIVPPFDVAVDNNLRVTEITRADEEEYYSLCTDEELNKLWGYDYKEDCKTTPTPEYFVDFRNSLIEKGEEYPLAIKENDKLIGEITLYTFDYFGNAEIGFRLKKEAQGKGIAIRCAEAVKNYAFNTLKVKTLKSRCFKQNIRSKNLIEKLGLKLTSEDEEKYYFSMQNPLF